MMFEGLRSRWTIPASCSASSPAPTCCVYVAVSREVERAVVEHLVERLPVDVLRREEAAPVGLARLEHRHEVRLADLGRGARLLLEAPAEDGSSISSKRITLSATTAPSARASP